MKVGDIVYVTKYALSSGVFKAKVKQLSSNKYVWIDYKDGLNHSMILKKNEVAATKSEAAADVRALASVRLGSLRKQIDKVEHIYEEAAKRVEAARMKE